jgi:DNA-binding response OmpR family regulator
VLTRDELMRLAPGESYDAFDRAIDNRIARLRQKLDTEAIVTVRAKGYMFVPPDRPGSAADEG